MVKAMEDMSIQTTKMNKLKEKVTNLETSTFQFGNILSSYSSNGYNTVSFYSVYISNRVNSSSSAR